MRWQPSSCWYFKLLPNPKQYLLEWLPSKKTNFLSFCGVKGGVVVETGCLLNLALQLVHVGGLPQPVYTHNMIQVQQEKCFENP